jgi:hypothetical protein
MRVTINLPDDIADGLRDMALGEYRAVREQAAWLVAQAVRAAQQRPSPASGYGDPDYQEGDDGPV